MLYDNPRQYDCTLNCVEFRIVKTNMIHIKTFWIDESENVGGCRIPRADHRPHFSQLVRVLGVPVSGKHSLKLSYKVFFVARQFGPIATVLKDKADAAGADKVVRGPVGGSNVTRLLGNHVLVVVDAGERDGSLRGGESGYLEETKCH